MKSCWLRAALCYLLTLMACADGGATAAPAVQVTPLYARLPGEVTLDNEHVRVERFHLGPGQSTGAFRPRGDQLLVFIKGGILTDAATGRAVLWRDGRVAWHGAGQPGDAGATNTGTTPVDFLWVTVKPAPPARGARAAPPTWRYLNYPNIPGEDLLENEHLIVQRFTVGPGQWEGPHGHHPNMLYIHIKGGRWAARSRSEPEHVYPDPDADGQVGWMTPIGVAEQHESGNAGTEPIDLIWVTLKR